MNSTYPGIFIYSSILSTLYYLIFNSFYCMWALSVETWNYYNIDSYNTYKVILITYHNTLLHIFIHFINITSKNLFQLNKHF